MKENSSNDKQLFITILGKSIRKRRRALGLTIDDLAYEAEVSNDHIGRIERGEKQVGIYIYAKIQSALHLDSAEYLEAFNEVKKINYDINATHSLCAETSKTTNENYTLKHLVSQSK